MELGLPIHHMQQEDIDSRYLADKELFLSYRRWHMNRYGTEPSSQQSILCCDWANHILNNPPTNDSTDGS